MPSTSLSAAIIAATILVSAVWSLADATAAADASAKSPIPPPAAQAAASKFVADAFAAEIAHAKKPAEKIALAKKLLETGTGEQKDLAVRYALLTQAVNTAAAAGDLQDAFDTVDQINQTYLIDALKMKSQTALGAVKAGRTTEDRKNFVFQVDPLIDQALAGDRYDVAVQLADVVLAQARLSNDATVSTQAIAHVQRVKAMAGAYRDLKIGAAPAEFRSADPTTNLKVGKFLCFMKGDWSHGLTILGLGNDPVLKEMAEADLKMPTDGQQQMALADRWWNLADSASALEQPQIRGRAGFWYGQAAPNLLGLLRTKAERRAAEAVKLASDDGGIPAKDRGWTVIFRSSDASIWNSDTNKGHESFAIALANAPRGIQYLRLAQPSGESLIIAMSNEQLGTNSAIEKGKHGWDGDGRFSCNGYHLGIFSLEIRRTKGIVDVGPAPGVAGWGFGNHINQDDKQAYGWAGKEIGVTVFEISVKTSALTKSEKENLVE